MAHDRKHRRATKKSEKATRKQEQKDAGMGWVDRQYADWTQSFGAAVGGEAGEAFTEGLTTLGQDVGLGEPAPEDDLGAPKQWDTLDEILSAMKRNRFARSSGYGQFFKGDRGQGQFSRANPGSQGRPKRVPQANPGGRPKRRGQGGRSMPGFGGAPQLRMGGY